MVGIRASIENNKGRSALSPAIGQSISFLTQRLSKSKEAREMMTTDQWILFGFSKKSWF
jgi:hypothetical protein